MMNSDATRFLGAAKRGVEWILGRQRDDGSFSDPEEGIGAYYKTPYVLSMAGRRREALLLLDWVSRHHLAADGDFRAPERKALEPFHEAWPVYANSWIVQASHNLGRWDLSIPGAGFICGRQTPSGGFPAFDGAKPFMEPVCTSWGGMAALVAGRASEARRAGDLLARMVVSQPDPSRFYFRMDLEGRLATDVPAGSELAYFVDSFRAKQIYFHPGIAMIFLASLFRATGDRRHLDACLAILDFTERCADDVYCFPPSGKLGAGCALLYSITGLPAARAAAVRVGNYLVDTQLSEGWWPLPDEEIYAGIKDKDSFDIKLDICSEFTTFLMEIGARV